MTTDADGRFELANVPARYDLVVVDPKRAHIVVFLGLTRDDLVIARADPRDSAEHTRQAQVAGTLSGGGPYPVDGAMHVHFSSSRARADQMLGGPNAPNELGPAFGPLKVAWDGPERIAGEVIAFRSAQRGGGRSAACVRQPVELKSGEVKTLPLTLVDVPSVRRPAGTIDYPEVIGRPVFHEEYRSPASGRVFAGESALPGQAFDAPDLSACGLTLCSESWIHNPYFKGRHTKCGFPLDQPLTLTLREAPVLSTPAWGTPAAVGLRFEWSPVPGAVYALTLTPFEPTPERPAIQVFTNETSATWPDLSAFGVPFPTPLATYSASVTALGPFTSLDQAASSEGLTRAIPVEAWSASSQEIGVHVIPPLNPEAARCQYERNAVIVCGEPRPGIEARQEHYVLRAINNKLRYYPAFADAAGVHCVTDCATARRFMKALADYREKHPGFDSDEPLEPSGPEPPPPPELLRRDRFGGPAM